MNIFLKFKEWKQEREFRKVAKQIVEIRNTFGYRTLPSDIANPINSKLQQFSLTFMETGYDNTFKLYKENKNIFNFIVNSYYTGVCHISPQKTWLLIADELIEIMENEASKTNKI